MVVQILPKKSIIDELSTIFLHLDFKLWFWEFVTWQISNMFLLFGIINM